MQGNHGCAAYLGAVGARDNPFWLQIPPSPLTASAPEKGDGGTRPPNQPAGEPGRGNTPLGRPPATSVCGEGHTITAL